MSSARLGGAEPDFSRASAPIHAVRFAVDDVERNTSSQWVSVLSGAVEDLAASVLAAEYDGAAPSLGAPRDVYGPIPARAPDDANGCGCSGASSDADADTHDSGSTSAGSRSASAVSLSESVRRSAAHARGALEMRSRRKHGVVRCFTAYRTGDAVELTSQEPAAEDAAGEGAPQPRGEAGRDAEPAHAFPAFAQKQAFYFWDEPAFQASEGGAHHPAVIRATMVARLPPDFQFGPDVKCVRDAARLLGTFAGGGAPASFSEALSTVHAMQAPYLKRLRLVTANLYRPPPPDVVRVVRWPSAAQEG